MGDNRANSADSRYHQDDSSHGLVPGFRRGRRRSGEILAVEPHQQAGRASRRVHGCAGRICRLMSVSIVPTLDMERATAGLRLRRDRRLRRGRPWLAAGPVRRRGRAWSAPPQSVGTAGATWPVLSPLQVPDGVADSKMLTEHRREAIFEELKSWCASWAVGSASNTEIDDWGISYALGIAALRALGQAEEKLGIDGAGCWVFRFCWFCRGTESLEGWCDS